MKVIYKQINPDSLRAEGYTHKNITIRDEYKQKLCQIYFPFRYFPLINVLMKAICKRLNSRKKVPVCWIGKTISIMSILKGKYKGFDHLNKLVEGAELWKM